MNGGLFEGIKKIFKSSNAGGINAIIVTTCAITSGIFTYAYSKIPPAILNLNKDAAETMVYKYLFLEKPLLGIFMLLVSFIMGAYIVNIAHNALKIFACRRENEGVTDKLPLLPEFNFNEILKPVLGMLTITAVWVIYFALLAIIATFIKLPLLIFIFVLLFITIMPMLFTGFAENYEIKPQLNPAIALNIIKKAFWHIWWLYIRYFGLSILIGIAAIILTIVCAIVFSIFGKWFAVFVVTTCIIYMSMICGIAFYYSSAFLYDKKIKDYN